ncbi:MAG: S-adenosylmethionine:tRNA ribosyltransferase-isomerase, partial [Paramuribaculum sp.]|nr:S-adenosylmethionine:tRNA ribosyltransferase-isomerase [Paramuribaculum sp.]
DHPMHSEFISVGLGMIEELARTDRRGVAVGTTSVRTLESLYWFGVRASRGESLDELPQWYPYDHHSTAMSRKEAMGHLLDRLRSDGSDALTADTRIIIAPGYRYRVVDAMVTNFHQPKSTLLLLVSAFTGGDWRRMYDMAMERKFRFLSYGDACLLL